MNAAALMAVEDTLSQQIDMLDVLSNFGVEFAYPDAWVDFVGAIGARIRTQAGRLEASWPVDEHHVERSNHVATLVAHMDDAGQRAAVITFLEKRK